MNDRNADGLKIGKWRVDPASGCVSSDAGELVLRPREMDLLLYLAKHQGQIVTSDDIISNVWSGVEVSNDSLYFSIGQLRKRLDDPDTDDSIIENLPKRGYRLTVPVRTPYQGDEGAMASAGEPQLTAALPRWRASRNVLYGVIAAALVFAVIGWFRGQDVSVLSSGGPSPASSIAVMPLIDLSPDTDYTYFSDGITDEILNRLARIRGLQVAARTSSFAFKDSETSVREIGEALDVGTILEGSVRKDGDLIRVSVQLIDTATGFQIWSETYERELSSIFEIQNDISRQIAGGLELTLRGDASEEGELLAADPRAVDEYLLGLEALRASSFESFRRAIAHFEKVLQIDPGFTHALIQLADAKLGLLKTGASLDPGLIDEAEAYVREALARDPGDGAAYRVLGAVSRWRGQWGQSRQQILKAIELAPSDSVAMVALGENYTIQHELGAARKTFERALRIDPYGAAALMKYAWLLQRTGDVETARATIERAIELHPANPNLPWMLGQIQVGEFGDHVAGLGNFLRSAELDPQDYEIAAYVAMTYLTLDMPEMARPWLERALRDGPDTPTSQAIEATYLQLAGDKRRATDIATAAIRGRNYRLLFHELLSENLVAIATRNLLDEGHVDYAVELFRDTLPVSSAQLGPGHAIVLDGVMIVMNKFSDSWMVALASLYAERGETQQADEVITTAAEFRLAEHARHGGTRHNDDLLTNARVAAIQGDDETALDLLEGAASRSLIFGWQIRVAGDYAFRHLQANPRFRTIVAGLQAETDRQREIVLEQALVTATSPESDIIH